MPTRETCAFHPDAAAAYRCEGCDRLLCPSCVGQSHALLLCKGCGERALPLADTHGATVREVKLQEAVAKPYPLQEAFSYPFRGLGGYMFLATLVSMAFVNFLLVVGIGCLPLLIAFLFATLLIALQFKIADTSARGETELPDWPEYLALWDRVIDLLTYGFLAFVQFAPLVAYVFLFGGPERVFTDEPSFVFYLGFAIFAWAGAAFWVVAFGAAGHYGRAASLRLDLHFQALASAKRDGLLFANIVFPLGLGFLVLRGLFEQLPILGAALSGIVGAYWTFVSAHLAGLIVRRNRRSFDAIYG
jgi:hypothetical protein